MKCVNRDEVKRWVKCVSEWWSEDSGCTEGACRERWGEESER